MNEFLKLLLHTGVVQRLMQQHARAGDTSGPQQQQLEKQEQQQQRQEHPSPWQVRVLDAGCGSAHLSWCTLHFLSHVHGLPVQLTGVDTNR